MKIQQTGTTNLAVADEQLNPGVEYGTLLTRSSLAPDREGLSRMAGSRSAETCTTLWNELQIAVAQYQGSITISSPLLFVGAGQPLARTANIQAGLR